MTAAARQPTTTAHGSRHEPAEAAKDARWRAVLSRDPAAEGRFVYAVRTTGIYCRPSCPARRPKLENVAFFATPEAARAAGFRPCRRCRPDEVAEQQLVVAQVRRLLDTTWPTPTLAQLGQAVGRSPSHLQRLFKRHTGLSPRQYARARRSERLAAQLRQGDIVAGAQYQAGYASSRALYEAAGDDLGMTPGRYRRGGAGETIRYGFTDTALGRALLAATDRGVCALRFGNDDETQTELAREFPHATLIHDDAYVTPYLERVRAHLTSNAQRLELPLDIAATAFQQQVWRALQQIPPGETRSYQQVAEMIGRPQAVRAVARACASNPVALAIPCHRVVRASGALSGYRWGVERKRTLLEREAGAQAPDPQPRDPQPQEPQPRDPQ